MEPSEPSAMVTGAGHGIGKQLAIELARKGYNLSLLDVDAESLADTAELIRLSGRRALMLKVDVSNQHELEHAFSKHKKCFGSMDVCCNNAGIGEQGEYAGPMEEGMVSNWQDVVDVNLIAVLIGTRLAIEMMESTKRGGHIINVSSAGGIYPMTFAPVYSASKAAVVQLGRSLTHLGKSKNIFVSTICPEFTRTRLLKDMESRLGAEECSRLVRTHGASTLDPSRVAQAAIRLLRERRGGLVLLLCQTGEEVLVKQHVKRVPFVARL